MLKVRKVQTAEAQLPDSDGNTGDNSGKSPPHEQRRAQEKPLK